MDDDRTNVASIPRAGTDDARSSSRFRPGADPDAWLDQHAAAYQERPEAALRELLQNAVDALLFNADQVNPFIEVAILSDKDLAEDSDVGRYHLVVRDSGVGMSEKTIRSILGVLGKSNKPDERYIGQFGVGFYAMHAICFEVVVISKMADEPWTAWRYVPNDKVFYELPDDELQALLRQDFENHPRPARARSHGTSVYMRLDVRRFYQCRNWLKPADLARQLRRDGVLVRNNLYVADYIDNPAGNRIILRGKDLSELSLSLGTAPWEAEGAELDTLLPRLFEQLLPYTTPDDFPGDWYAFRTAVDDGFVSGFLYLVDPTAKGFFDLYLKGLHVETAEDLAPSYAFHVFGLVNITPGTRFDPTVLAARDHVVRNDLYINVCQAVEDACADFFTERGTALLGELARSTQNAPGSTSVFQDLRAQLNSSMTYRVLCSLNRTYRSLFADLPEALNRLITAPACSEALKEAVINCAKRISHGQITINPENISAVLQNMQIQANESYESERAKQRALRTAPSWNPRSSRRFFERVGPYLPFTVFRREQQPSGQVGFQTERVPLAAVELLDAQSATVLKVLTNGSPSDYLVRNPNVSLIVQPQSEDDLIALCLARELCFPDLKLDFVTFERDIFHHMATRLEWTPLVDLLKRVLSVHNQTDSATDTIEVDARGYNPDYVPLLEHVEDGKPVLVINGYNDLMQALKAGYRVALEGDDMEVVEIIGLVLHELLHHASPAMAVRPAEERHVVGSRTELLKAVLSVIQKYTDFKLRQ